MGGALDRPRPRPAPARTPARRPAPPRSSPAPGTLHAAPAGSPARRQDPTAQWLQFAVAQAARCAPHPAPAALVRSAPSAPFRLRLSHLEGLPLFQSECRNFEVRVGVTLFDAGPAAGPGGAFFGPTVFSAPVEYDMRKSRG